MYRLSSSFRTRTADESLIYAKKVASSMGVTRVTNVTWLDKIGIPVFAGIRPYASEGSLNVHAGKGLLDNEAKIGAYMESIEFSLVDEIRHVEKLEKLKVSDVIKSYNSLYSLSSFGIRLGTRVCADDEIYCVRGYDIINGMDVIVPAELVFHPFHNHGGGLFFGGTTTNGLCSGNTPLEAIIHGVCEVLERDVNSFNYIEDRSRIVHSETEPASVKMLRRKIEDAGLILILRKTINEFNLPFYSAYVLEKSNKAFISIADGFGLHPVAEIAAIRAVTEAVQSRLSHIHGGRDDIIDRVKHFQGKEIGLEENILNILRKRITSCKRHIDFYSQDEKEINYHDLNELFDFLKLTLIKNGLNGCINVQLSQDDFPFSVQRVIIPHAEYVEPKMRRVGIRFANAFNKKRTDSSTGR